MLPVGDYPNPRTPQWVTRILIAANVAIFLFVTVPLGRRLSPEELRDPEVQRQIAEMVRVEAEHEGREPDVRDAIAAAQGLTRYDLFVFRHGYKHNLVQQWLPALEGVTAKLERGAEVADVGCGHGASTLIMARAYPKSRFTGFDYHPASVATARAAAG